MRVKKAAWATVLIALAGCKSAPALHVTKDSPATLPSGWTAASSRDGLVSVGIPSGWRSGVDKLSDNLTDLIPSTDNSITGGPENSESPSGIAAQIDRDSQEKEQKALEALEKKGIVINVINSSKPIPGEARTRFYVRRYQSGGNVTWDDAKATERQNYAHAQTPKEINLPIGKALKYSADDELRDGGVLHQISYVVVEGHNVYCLRFVTEESGDVISSLADQVAQTWRIRA